MLNRAFQAISRLDDIMMSGTIRIGTTGDYKPYTYYNRENETYEGYDIDMAQRLASDLGVSVEFVPTTWPSLMDDLLHDRFDIAMGGISRNVERQKLGHLTQGYMKDGKALLVRKTDKDRYLDLHDVDQPEVKIGVNPGGTNEVFVKSHIRQAQIITIEKNLSIPEMVAEGLVDVMITDCIESIYYSNLDSRLYAGLTNRPLTRCQKGYLIQRGDPDYANWISLWMEEMELQGVFEQTKAKWGLAGM